MPLAPFSALGIGQHNTERRNCDETHNPICTRITRRHATEELVSKSRAWSVLKDITYLRPL